MKSTGKRLEAGIYRIGTRKYWVTVGIDGNQYKDSKVVTGSIDDARAVRATLKRGLLEAKKERSLKAESSTSDTGNAFTVVTVSDVLNRYVQEHYKNSAQYQEGSGKHLIEILRVNFGKIVVSALSADDLDFFVKKMLNTPARPNGEEFFKPSGINPYISRLRSAFNHCKIENKALKEFKLLKEKKHKLTVWSDSILDLIKKEIPQRHLAVILFKELVPCRILELFKARKTQLDLKQRKIHLLNTKTGEPRDLPIPEVLLPYFNWSASIPMDVCPFIFCYEVKDSDGNTIEYRPYKNDTIGQAIRRIKKRYNISDRIMFRTLRHTAISNWLRVFDPGLVSDTAGASLQTILNHYDVVPIEAKVSAADKFAAIRTGQIKADGNQMETLNNICKFPNLRRIA